MRFLCVLGSERVCYDKVVNAVTMRWCEQPFTMLVADKHSTKCLQCKTTPYMSLFSSLRHVYNLSVLKVVAQGMKNAAELPLGPSVL